MTVLVLPGIDNSGPGHWQTRWEGRHPDFRRVPERDWSRPVCRDWVASLDAAVRDAGPDTWIVAHSLGCLQAVHWAAQSARRVNGAMLVAPPDPDAITFPEAAEGFSPVPMRRLPFPSVLAVSTDDPFADRRFNEACAQAWGSRLVTFANHGHLNAESGIGDWPAGWAIWQELIGERHA